VWRDYFDLASFTKQIGQFRIGSLNESRRREPLFRRLQNLIEVLTSV